MPLRDRDTRWELLERVELLLLDVRVAGFDVLLEDRVEVADGLRGVVVRGRLGAVRWTDRELELELVDVRRDGRVTRLGREDCVREETGLRRTLRVAVVRDDERLGWLR